MKYLMIAIGVFVFFSVTSGVMADEMESSVVNSTEMKQQREERRLEQEKKEAEMEQQRLEIRTEQEERVRERSAEMCKKAEEKVMQHRERYSEYAKNHVERYRHIEDVLESVIARLDASGLDVTKLTLQLQTMHSMVNELDTVSAEYDSQLVSAESLDCDEDGQMFKESLDEAKASLEDVKAQRDAIREYVTNTIRTELQALKTTATTESAQ